MGDMSTRGNVRYVILRPALRRKKVEGTRPGCRRAMIVGRLTRPPIGFSATSNLLFRQARFASIIAYSCGAPSTKEDSSENDKKAMHAHGFVAFLLGNTS